jgi:hypothetical protein
MQHIKPADKDRLDALVGGMTEEISKLAGAYGFDGAHAVLMNYVCARLVEQVTKLGFGVDLSVELTNNSNHMPKVAAPGQTNTTEGPPCNICGRKTDALGNGPPCPGCGKPTMCKVGS